MSWTRARRTFEVPCTVEIEQTSETLHAHVVLDGDVRIQPGDEVMVHNAPTRVEFGERLVVRRTATVVRGSALELTELYEVSFSDGRAA